MEQPLDTLNAFRPRTGTPDQWNAAFIRVEDYLRAHRVHNRLQQITILQKVIARAAARHEQNPTLDTVDGVSLEFADWRMNLRMSNTEPLLRLNIESRGQAGLVAEQVSTIERIIAG